MHRSLVFYGAKLFQALPEIYALFHKMTEYSWAADTLVQGFISNQYIFLAHRQTADSRFILLKQVVFGTQGVI